MNVRKFYGRATSVDGGPLPGIFLSPPLRVRRGATPLAPRPLPVPANYRTRGSRLPMLRALPPRAGQCGRVFGDMHVRRSGPIGACRLSTRSFLEPLRLALTLCLPRRVSVRRWSEFGRRIQTSRLRNASQPRQPSMCCAAAAQGTGLRCPLVRHVYAETRRSLCPQRGWCSQTPPSSCGERTSVRGRSGGLS